jgi:hypothetical protein
LTPRAFARSIGPMGCSMTLDERFAVASADWEKIRDQEWVTHGIATPDRSKSGVRGNACVLET